MISFKKHFENLLIYSHRKRKNHLFNSLKPLFKHILFHAFKTLTLLTFLLPNGFFCTSEILFLGPNNLYLSVSGAFAFRANSVLFPA